MACTVEERFAKICANVVPPDEVCSLHLLAKVFLIGVLSETNVQSKCSLLEGK